MLLASGKLSRLTAFTSPRKAVGSQISCRRLGSCPREASCTGLILQQLPALGEPPFGVVSAQSGQRGCLFGFGFNLLVCVVLFIFFPQPILNLFREGGADPVSTTWAKPAGSAPETSLLQIQGETQYPQGGEVFPTPLLKAGWKYLVKTKGKLRHGAVWWGWALG